MIELRSVVWFGISPFALLVHTTSALSALTFRSTEPL